MGRMAAPARMAKRGAGCRRSGDFWLFPGRFASVTESTFWAGTFQAPESSPLESLAGAAHLPRCRGTAGMNLIPQWFPSLWPLLYLPIGLMSLTRSFLLIWQATRAFGEWRRSGELEILLTTAVPEREIVRRGWDQFRPVLVRMFVVGAAASGVMTALSRTFQTMASPSPAPRNGISSFTGSARKLPKLRNGGRWFGSVLDGTAQPADGTRHRKDVWDRGGEQLFSW